MTKKIIFFGTSDFAVPSLRSLMNNTRFEICGIVTQPDRPAGRDQQMTPSPVTQFVISSPSAMLRAGSVEKSLDDNLLHQPEKLSDPEFTSWIESVGSTCDVFVVVSFGRLLPPWLVDLPKQGVINVHPSLLPLWRGPSPIQSAIAHGDAETGVTIMKIDAEMDHGPILSQKREPIRPDDNAPILHDRLADIGAQMLPDAIVDYLDGRLQPQEQNHTQATICKILTRDNGRVNLETDSPEHILRLLRAFDPWPGVWTMINDKRVKILKAHQQDGKLILDRVQPEGKKEMSGDDFFRGTRS